MTDWQPIDIEQAVQAENAEAEIARLTAEVERLTKGSICEVAATNPSVMEYMRHWEGRAEKAETERDTLVAAAYEAAAYEVLGSNLGNDIQDIAEDVRTLTPADAQAAIDKLLAEARLSGLDVAANMLSDLEAENQRLRATLSAITATDCYSRDECTAMARAALRSTENSHDD